jgi:hypothetical protein
MTRIQVNIPEGTVGDWSVKVATGDSSTIFTEANGFPTISNWSEPYDTYTFLVYAPVGAVMQDTTAEYAQHEPLWQGATGDVLIGGLGIGFVNQKLMDNPNVTSVTIIEKNQEVIDLVWQHCPKDARFSLVHADIETWVPPEGSYWHYAWFDTWIGGNPMDLPEYDQFIRNKFASYCEEIGVWSWNLPSE